MTVRTILARFKQHPSEGRIARAFERIGTFKLLLIFYALFVVTQVVLNGYCKHLETYDDEWIYYGIAQSLAKGMGFPAIYGDAFTSHTRYLYSLLIAPGLLVSDRLLQFRLIAALNALALGSGAFPTYLLAKRVLEEDKLAILAGLIYLVLPDAEFTATFMTENLWLPTALWTVWFFYRLISERDASHKSRAITVVLLFLLAAALVNIKSAGIPIIVALCLYFLLLKVFQFSRARRSDNKKMKGLMRGALIATLLVIVFILLNLYQSIGARATVVVSRISTYLATDPARYLWCYVYIWATELLAIGVFPVILPLMSFRELSMPVRRLFVLALLLTFVANFGVADVSLESTELIGATDFLLHHRYVAYLWILYMIPFLYVAYHGVWPRLLPSVVCVVVTLAFCTVFQGAVIASSVDMSLLYWARDWMAHRKMWIALVVFFVGIGLLLLRLGRIRAFRLFFFGAMLVAVAYDHWAMHSLINTVYGFEYAGIEDTERFVQDNPESTFLVVTLPNSVSFDNVEVHYNAKVADTFLVYPNSIFASGKWVMGLQTNHGIDLSEVGMDDTGIAIVGPRKIKSVDYVVLTTEMSIDESMCEQVGGDSFFSIYRLDDNTKIPPMQSFNNWYLPGKTTLQPASGFASDYAKDGDAVFVSGENPGYVLHGPGVTLKPGRYSTTVHYSYEGDAAGTIGTMSLSGSVLDAAQNQTEVRSDKDAVSISFDLLESCDAFEVRLFADVPGIRVESIDVEMLSIKQVDEAGLKVRQFFNASGSMVREECYTGAGDKTINESGFFAVDHTCLYGNRVSNSFYDLDGRLVTMGGGYAVARYSYDEHRRIIREEYYGTNGEKVSRYSYHSIEYIRDENGDAVELRYLDEHDEGAVLPEGYSIVRRWYDDNHRIIREEFYSPANEPVVSVDGYFMVEYKYDNSGNVAESRYYDLNGNEVTTS